MKFNNGKCKLYNLSVETVKKIRFLQRWVRKEFKSKN